MIGDDMNKRKRQVIEASLQLFIEKGFQKTSIQDILDKAQISKGTFYNYFSSKNDCMLAIMEQRRYEASLLRNEMIAEKDKTDIDILVKQSTVFAEINERQNLMAVFEEIFHSGDPELKEIVSFHKSHELEWLTNRFIDVFGEASRPYAYECAVIFLGMKQHITMTWRETHHKRLDPLIVSKLAMRNIQAILPQMIKTKEVLLDAQAYYIMNEKLAPITITKQQLADDLQVFQKELQASSQSFTSGEELCDCLLQELLREQPRYAVINALLKPFREAFENTPFQRDVQELCNHFWTFLNIEK